MPVTEPIAAGVIQDAIMSPQVDDSSQQPLLSGQPVDEEDVSETLEHKVCRIVFGEYQFRQSNTTREKCSLHTELRNMHDEPRTLCSFADSHGYRNVLVKQSSSVDTKGVCNLWNGSVDLNFKLVIRI